MGWGRAVLGLVLFTACASAERVDHHVPPRYAAAPESSAIPADEPAHRYLDEALRLYARQEYEQAAVAFEAAYLRDPEPGLLLARAQALRLAGACERARPLYDRFLAQSPDPTMHAALVRIADDCR